MLYPSNGNLHGDDDNAPSELRIAYVQTDQGLPQKEMVISPLTGLKISVHIQPKECLYNVGGMTVAHIISNLYIHIENTHIYIYIYIN